MGTFLLTLLGSLIGTYVALKLAGGKITHNTYISCPKGVPKNITDLAKSREELARLLKKVNKHLDFLEEKRK